MRRPGASWVTSTFLRVKVRYETRDGAMIVSSERSPVSVRQAVKACLVGSIAKVLVPDGRLFVGGRE